VSDDSPVGDRVGEQRARLARVVRAAKRVGYGGLLVAIVAFFVGVATQFPGWTVTLAVIGLVVACVVLPLPIVLGYGIRAAEREERATRRRAGGTPGADA